MIYAVYDEFTGEIERSVDIPEPMKHLISLSYRQSIIEIPRMIFDTPHCINNGKLCLDAPKQTP